MSVASFFTFFSLRNYLLSPRITYLLVSVFFVRPTNYLFFPLIRNPWVLPHFSRFIFPLVALHEAGIIIVLDWMLALCSTPTSLLYYDPLRSQTYWILMFLPQLHGVTRSLSYIVYIPEPSTPSICAKVQSHSTNPRFPTVNLTLFFTRGHSFRTTFTPLISSVFFFFKKNSKNRTYFQTLEV